MKLKIAIAVLVVFTLAVGAVAVRYDVVNRIRYIGTSPAEAVSSLFQILRKDGVLNTLRAVRNKFGNDPRLGIGYSLYDKAAYPPIESAAERNALPEYQIIPAVDVATLPPSRGAGSRYDTWQRSNGDDSSSKFSALDQIRAGNVANLEVAWTYSAGPFQLTDATRAGAPVETNPIVVNGRLFVASINGHLLSLDATTGRELWRVEMPPPVARRGLVWEPNADFSQSRLFVPTGRGVYAVNAATGAILSEFGNGGQVGDQLSLIAPVIAGDKLVVALIKPAIEGYDLRTGQLAWTRPLLEADSNATLLTGGVPWAGMSFDPARSRVYVATGNPRPELWGSTRPGANKHSSSVVAIDTNTGEIAWAFQEIAHDLWDLDVPSPPVLTTITRGGRQVDVVAAVTKMGNTLLLDRDFGKPIFDYRLKRAPVSRVPGEQTAPYQPALELPEPVLKQVFDPADVTDITEADRQTVLQKIRGAVAGFYEPPVLGGKVVLFGLGGGAVWPGAAVNPNSGILYVPSNHAPWIVRANYRDLRGAERAVAGMPGDAPYQAKCARCHGPARDGLQELNAGRFGHYYPALTGITLLRSRDALTSTATFSGNHEGFNLGFETSRQELDVMFEYFSGLDKIADSDNALAARTAWGPLQDSSGRPGSTPPWGLLTALDLNSGKKVWQVPFGEYSDVLRNGQPVRGQLNVGGAIATAGGLVFATGTLDGKVRAFDSANGQELWSFALPAGGSAAPSTYLVAGTQYLVVVTSARPTNPAEPRFDKIVAFKLPARSASAVRATTAGQN